MTSENLKKPDQGGLKKTDLQATAMFLGGLALFGLLAIFLWGATRSISAIALGELLLGGSALVGGVLGLLFGIPKSISDPAAAKPPADTNNAGNNRESPTSYAVNTNLEQISDWLTKIIVGVGLTQIAAIRDQFREIAVFFGNGFIASGAAAPVAAALILVYGLAAGFLAGYLLTRIFLPGAFVRADAQLRERNDQLVQQLVDEKKLAVSVGSVQGEIYQDLYKDEGFRDAIAKLEKLLDSEVQRYNPALWTYLAAAHGQAWKWENEHRPDNDSEKSKILEWHRDEALRSVREALSDGDAWKPILQVMWDKNHPIKKEGSGKEENDLEVFYDDPEFKKLLT